MDETLLKSWLPVLVAVVVILLFGGWAALRIRVWLDRMQRLRRSRRAVSGEVKARSWLGKNGFTILGEQQSLFCTMLVDGRPVEYEVCADFVVERNGERAIVEVKTGGAAQPSSPKTRRQILEYAMAYGVNRAYMFDGDRSTLHEMVFHVVPPSYAPRAKRVTGWQIGLAGFLLGVLCTAAVVWWLTQ